LGLAFQGFDHQKEPHPVIEGLGQDSLLGLLEKRRKGYRISHGNELLYLLRGKANVKEHLFDGRSLLFFPQMGRAGRYQRGKGAFPPDDESLPVNGLWFHAAEGKHPQKGTLKARHQKGHFVQVGIEKNSGAFSPLVEEEVSQGVLSYLVYQILYGLPEDRLHRFFGPGNTACLTKFLQEREIHSSKKARTGA